MSKRKADESFLAPFQTILQETAQPAPAENLSSLNKAIYTDLVSYIQAIQEKITENVVLFDSQSPKDDPKNKTVATKLEIFQILFQAYKEAATLFNTNKVDAGFALQKAQRLESMVNSNNLGGSLTRIQQANQVRPEIKTLEGYKKDIENKIKVLRQKSIAEQAIFKELIIQLEERNQEQGLPPPMEVVQEVQGLQEVGDQVMEQLNQDLDNFYQFVVEQLATFTTDVTVPITNYFESNQRLVEMVQGAQAQEYYRSNLYRELNKQIANLGQQQAGEMVQQQLNTKRADLLQERGRLEPAINDPLIQGAIAMINERVALLNTLLASNINTLVGTIKQFQPRR